MASIWLLQFPSLPFQHRVSSNGTSLLLHHRHCLCQRLNWIPLTPNGTFSMRAIHDSVSSEEDNRAQNEAVDTGKSTLAVVDSKHPLALFQESITSLPPVVFLMKNCPKNYFTMGLCISIAIMVVALRAYAERKSSQSHPGSVADLVRRGQLRSDRRDQDLSITLTEEQQAIHQKRRSRAYQWKRPTVFLKEGDSIPPDVDPDTIRWIPANHPFATTSSDIDEGLAQNNVYQQRGVPFRIQAEHDALQRKLEALQKEEKLNNLFIDSRNAKDFQRPFKLNDRPEEPVEQGPINNSRVETKPAKPELASDSIESKISSEEMQQP
ncbi:hypothetical protein V6N12_040332 [Hibiscus sabdariffa]|uniref:Protein MULTIPLE CHLOROPLAST DIVISION SITE 1 n=1 Tax=Hibiscus sabdariffa TaxID=183260 RepID=A0ABR2E6Z3_9ROSI